jgi:hypothetical protein
MPSRLLLPAGLCAIAALALPAAPADAFTVSAQAEIRPPKRFPVALAGGFAQGERIPRGHVLLRRTVQIAAREGNRNVTFTCPGRRRVRTIGLNDPSTIGLGVSNAMRRYTRRTRVTLFVYAPASVVGPAGTGRGRVYVLCRRR